MIHPQRNRVQSCAGHDHSEGKVGLMVKPTMGNSQETQTHTREGTSAAATRA